LSERYIKIFSSDYHIVNRYYNTLRKKGYGDPNAAYPTAEETLIGKLCSAYGTLISSYSRLNDYDKANLYAKEALHVHSQLRLQIRRYGASSLYPTLFRAFFDSRDTENTEKMVRLMESYMGDLISRPSIERNQSLDMANMNQMPLFQSLAFYHFHQKDYKQAETYYRQYLLAMEKLVNQTNAMAKDLEKTGIKFKPVSFIPIDDFLIDCLIKQNQIDTAWQMA
jgi:hypothetical protein